MRGPAHAGRCGFHDPSPAISVDVHHVLGLLRPGFEAEVEIHPGAVHMATVSGADRDSVHLLQRSRHTTIDSGNPVPGRRDLRGVHDASLLEPELPRVHVIPIFELSGHDVYGGGGEFHDLRDVADAREFRFHLCGRPSWISAWQDV
jgi:hypothetical protein